MRDRRGRAVSQRRRSVKSTEQMMPDLRDIAARARALARDIDRLCSRRLRSTSESFSAWSDRWFNARRSRGVERERRMFSQFIAPILGEHQVRDLGRVHIEEWVEAMDDSVRDGSIAWRTAVRRWTLLRAMLRDLSRAKRGDLRVLDHDIVSSVRGPDRGHDRAGTWLMPSEFLRLAQSRRVPLDRRRLYVLAVYLAARAGELDALTWSDVDLKSGQVHITKSIDLETGEVGPTKTGQTRRFLIEPNLRPLLEAIRGKPSSPVAPPWHRQGQAEMLRSDLRRAGISRAELFRADAHHRPLTFHDLRASGITWWAMRGDAMASIMDRAGHIQLATTQRYIRRGTALAGATGETPFPELPRSLLGRSTK